MPRAVIIEFTGSSSVSITTGNTHGNTVRSTFLYFAPSGWDADVISCPYDSGVAAYNWIAERTATYSLAICSNVLDVFYLRNVEKVQRVLGIPLFLALNNSGSPSIYEQAVNAIHSGAGTSSNIAEQSYSILTFAEATNLSAPNNLYTSFSNAVVAGRAAALVDTGLSASQIWRTVRQQSSDFPAWTSANGYGSAPLSYSVPVSYEPAPVLASEMWRSSNTLNIVFSYLEGTTPTHLKVYRNGVLDGTYAAATWTSVTGVSSLIGTSSQYRVAHNVVSDGGAFEFDLTLQYADGESDRGFGYTWTISGFTDNFEEPSPDPNPPSPEPTPEQPEIPQESVSSDKPVFMFIRKAKPVFSFIKKQAVRLTGIGYMRIGTNFIVS